MKLNLVLFLALCFVVFAPQPNATESQPEPLKAETAAVNTAVAPFATIQLDKQNYLYLGIDNPITVHTNGLNHYDFTLKSSPSLTFRGMGKHYVIKASKPGEHKITVLYKGEPLETFSFVATRMPDPKAYLGPQTFGSMLAEDFKAQMGISAPMSFRGICGHCKILGYEILRISSDHQKTRLLNKGGKFSTEAKAHIQRAEAGDFYHFTNVRARCPGDDLSRMLNPLVFEIK